MLRKLFISLSVILSLWIIGTTFATGSFYSGKSTRDTLKNTLKMDDNSKYNELTPEEEYVILRKGTEYPFTGTLLENKKKRYLYL